MADVDRVDAGGAALEQAIGESTRARAEISSREAVHVELERTPARVPAFRPRG